MANGNYIGSDSGLELWWLFCRGWKSKWFEEQSSSTCHSRCNWMVL